MFYKYNTRILREYYKKIIMEIFEFFKRLFGSKQEEVKPVEVSKPKPKKKPVKKEAVVRNEKTYYENGKLESEVNYKNDRPINLKLYHENGKLKQEGNYKNSLEDGIHKAYHKNGELRAEECFINGELNGISKIYYENGKLETEVNYKNGVIESEVHYKNGVENKIWKTILTESKTIYFHQTDSKGTLSNVFDEEGYTIPFFENAPNGVHQRAQRHTLYEIELPKGFDEKHDDPLLHTDWESIIAVYYIQGYLEVDPPEKCYVLGIDIDDNRTIMGNDSYNCSGYSQDDSGVSKAEDLGESPFVTFENYIKKFTKLKKETFL